MCHYFLCEVVAVVLFDATRMPYELIEVVTSMLHIYQIIAFVKSDIKVCISSWAND